MPLIFISYRHRDSIDITARLCDRLKSQFGDSNLFLDNLRLKGGDDFLEVIYEAIDNARALLCVIGPKWKGEGGPTQNGLIHDPADVVRQELERARRRDLPILPVMVSKASYLTASELPDSLKWLARKQALPLRSGLDFEGDVRRIVECLRRLTGKDLSRQLLAGLHFPFSPPLSSPTSQYRSTVLLALRTGAVVGLVGTAFALVRSLMKANEIQALPRLTTLGASTLVIALSGAALLIISYLRIRLVGFFARQRQEAALKELTTLILARLKSPSLLSANSLRSLAISIEQKHRCPVITDKLIAEAIRSAAIALEYSASGEELENNMRRLNTALLTIDESASPLCSVAVVDRLGAYVQSQPILVAGLVVALLWAVIWPIFVGVPWSTLTLTVTAGVTAIAFLLWLSTERAIKYWRTDETDAKQSSVLPNRQLWLSDLFLRASCSRSRWSEIFWHQTWGPTWEGLMFARRSDREVIAMHEFRFDVARGLWKKLKATDIELEESPAQDRATRSILEQRFQEIARQLWIVTGEPQFRQIETRGHILREDRSSGIVGLL